MKSKVAFYTLGCKLNFSETSTMGEQFLNHGHEVVEFDSAADIYVINTCTVTQNAEKDCRQIVRRALRKNPEAFVIVTGCYAQLRPDDIVEIEGVDVVLGSNEKFKLFEYINSFEKKELSCVYVSDNESLEDFHVATSTEADSRTRAFLKIQDGCDYKCSFCTIPKARGKSRSASPELVIDNLKRLLDEGYKEVILTGVNVGDYGVDQKINFADLLHKMVQVEGDFRMRISSIEPNLLTDEILDLTDENEKLVNHFHIPLQSGSPEILKLMQRRYKVDYFHDLIYRAHEKIADLGIGIDVIVGFPGETHEHFLETYNLLNELPISYLHVFTYSERPGTKAEEMSGVVDVFDRKKRNNMLRILSAKKKNAFYRSMLGKDMDVLWEHQNIDGKMRGFASNYTRVETDFDENFVNKISKVNLLSTDGNVCNGVLLPEISAIKTIAG
ncbi:MAG: tRNA (N(6)-L-threonylcarbamoyladenosine(37)-C(2))-methylthiotransferase MtaB [Melioribacteraceae bacterium]|nr:MAG: tRNA (N(6)-L-threonylcarbamoyladenosine(37)-C(2))-methylthiotransferase MtaB [Melioribacteraceae bacterium]